MHYQLAFLPDLPAAHFMSQLFLFFQNSKSPCLIGIVSLAKAYLRMRLCLVLKAINVVAVVCVIAINKCGSVCVPI